MRKFLIGLGVAGVLVAARLASRHPEAAADPASRAAATAAGIQALAPKEVDNAVTILGAEADGGTVNVRVRLEQGFTGQLTSGERTRMFTAILCRQPGYASFVRQGGAMRWNLLRRDGSLFDSVLVDHCPDAG